MADADKPSWRQVVAGYLRACWEDALNDRQTALSNALTSFLRESATPSIQRDYEETANNRLDALLPAADESHWRIIEDGRNRVLVEVTVAPDGPFSARRPPFVTTRLVLTGREGTWRLCDILHPCLDCNAGPGVAAGQCFYCGGTGTSTWKEASPPCSYCHGTGNCAGCSDEDVAGWRRASCLQVTPPDVLGG